VRPGDVDEFKYRPVKRNYIDQESSPARLQLVKGRIPTSRETGIRPNTGRQGKHCIESGIPIGSSALLD
jgi:hypothetical protein